MDIHKTIILSLAILGSCVSVKGAPTVLFNYNTSHFETNAEPWRIAVKTSLVQQVTAPFIDMDEFWYDPFVGNTVAAGTIGVLGWEAQAGGAGTTNLEFTNAPGHFGIMCLYVNSTATTMRNIYLSEEPNSKPSIPASPSTFTWTNRIIWRLVDTNDVRVYLILGGAGDITHNNPYNQAVGIIFDTNSNQIKGYAATTGTPATTNLVTMEDGVWYTNNVWCQGDGIWRYSANDGPVATLAVNITASALTPRLGLVRTDTGVTNCLQLDSWFFRPPNGL